MKLVFVALPTKGAVENGAIKAEVVQLMARLHEKYPQRAFIAPMIQDYQLLPYLTLDATYDVWGQKCEAILSKCDAVWVLLMDGWQLPHDERNEQNTSVGVHGEIQCACRHGIPVVYVNPDDL